MIIYVQRAKLTLISKREEIKLLSFLEMKLGRKLNIFSICLDKKMFTNENLLIIILA
jgi:hypothetical protein